MDSFRWFDRTRPYESWVAFWIAVLIGHFIDLFLYRFGESARQRKAQAQIAWDTEMIKRGVQKLPNSQYLPYTNTRRLAHQMYSYILVLILVFWLVARFFLSLLNTSNVDSGDTEVVTKSFDFSAEGWN